MGSNHKSCCVINCKNNGKNSTCKFYTFPVAEWKIPQRNKWIAAINRRNPDGSLWHPKPHDTICSAHFVGGQKSDAEASPSYVPSIFPPNHSQVASKLIIFMKKIKSDQQSVSKDSIDVEDISAVNENKQNKIDDKECQAGTSNLKLKLTETISSEIPETFLTTEVKVEPGDVELDQCYTEDDWQNCEVIIEQPRHVNEEEVESDSISFEVKTEPSDDEMHMTQLQTDQISVVVKAEPLDDEEETAQVQREGISVVVKAEPYDEEEETLSNQQQNAVSVAQELETPLKPSKKRRRKPLSNQQQNGVSVAQELETPLKPSKKRRREPESMESLSRSPSPQRSRLTHRGDDSFRESFYGSDLDSDESDEEDMFVPFFPRAQRTALETPVDPYTVPDAAPVSATSTTTTNNLDVPLKATAQPCSPYQFNWKPFPNVPTPPDLRREVFSRINNRNVGPTAPCVDPYDIFVAIWDRQFMEHIASETNRYAQQVAARMLENNSLRPKSRITKWRDTTVDELYVFFGIVLAMGIVVKTRIEEYWSTSPDIFFTPGFSAHMRAARFRILGKCLHFSNNEDLFALNLDVSEAKLFKVKPVLSHLNKKFSSMYRLRQNIVLDESLLQWKGRLNINQLVPSQSASVGIKTYEICDAQSGYLWRFEIHSHKKSRSPPQQFEDPMKASTPAIVLRLLNGLEGKGHTLWMDSSYNSPCLARRLKSLGFDCAGTLRTNRAFVPQVLHRLTKDNMQEGQISGFTSGDVDVVVWKDVNKISMISTYHGIATSQTLEPLLINDYNTMMGGVDKRDQMLATYPIERKRTKVWYKKLFRRLLNVSVLNAFIIHRESLKPSFSSSSSTLLSHRNFRSSLVKALLSRHCSATPLAPGTSQIHLNKTFDVSHRLAEYPFGTKTNNQRLRRKCVKCSKLVQTYCVGCNATVCMDPCFLAFHS